MLENLPASEINRIVSIVKAAVAGRSKPASALTEIMAMHRLNADLIVNYKADDYGLVTALLLILEDPDCYELASEKPPLVTDVIEKICCRRPILNTRDWGKRLEIDLGL